MMMQSKFQQQAKLAHLHRGSQSEGVGLSATAEEDRSLTGAAASAVSLAGSLAAGCAPAAGSA